MPALLHKSIVGVDKESTWGVGVAPVEYVEAVSCGLRMNREIILQAGVNNTRTKKKHVTGLITAGGPLAWELNPEDMIGHVLKSLLPTEGLTDNGVGNGGKHNFTPGDALPVGYSFTRTLDHNTRRFYGCQVTSLKLDQSAEGLLMAEAEIVAKNEETASLPTATYTTEKAWVFHQAVITMDGGDAALENWSVEINGNLNAKRSRIGQEDVQVQTPHVYGVTGSFESAFDSSGTLSQTLVDKFKTGTTAALKLKWTGTAIGGGFLRFIEVDCPVIVYKGEQPIMDGPDGEVKIKPTFEAIATGAYLIQVSLQNSRRTAY